MLAEMRRHIETKFEAAELHRYPFPHLIIESFFPDAVYDSVLRYNLFRKNPGTEWYTEDDASKKKTRTPYWMRSQINFHESVDQLLQSPEERDFWTTMRDCFLQDGWFIRLVMSKYKDYFAIRFGEIAEAPRFPALFKKELFLQQHKPGYYIGPHTDVPQRVFTCIFSFAESAGFEEFGTQLCKHKDPLVRCWGNDHYRPDDFIVQKVAPYKPNNFLLFFKTRQSFHSVKAIDETVPNRRYGMQFQLIEPSNGLFSDLSEPQLMASKT